MGQHVDWVCKGWRCDTQLKELSGGMDRGFMSFTETRICDNCNHVADYEINKAERMGGGKSDAPDIEPPCSKCNSPTRPWDKRCPDCGKKMKRDPHGSVVMWD